MAAVLKCRAWGAQPRAGARFCDACGAQIEVPAAEYKQVTVLFADVVRSMDLASSLDAERLREIMADLVDRSAAVVQHYGGTVDKFTGDGIMAVFGAPTRWKTTLSVPAWRPWRSRRTSAPRCNCGSA